MYVIISSCSIEPLPPLHLLPSLPPPPTYTHFLSIPHTKGDQSSANTTVWRNTGTVIPHLIWKAILYPPIAFPLRHQSKWSPPEIKDYIPTKLSGGDRYNSKRLFFTISIVQQSLTNWTLSIISVKCLYFILNNKLIVFSKI